MAPTREQLRRAFERHLECWNEPDREGWIALFDPDVRFDDPVGVPTKHGLEAAARQWVWAARRSALSGLSSAVAVARRISSSKAGSRLISR